VGLWRDWIFGHRYSGRDYQKIQTERTRPGRFFRSFRLVVPHEFSAFFSKEHRLHVSSAFEPTTYDSFQPNRPSQFLPCILKSTFQDMSSYRKYGLLHTLSRSFRFRGHFRTCMLASFGSRPSIFPLTIKSRVLVPHTGIGLPSQGFHLDR